MEEKWDYSHKFNVTASEKKSYAQKGVIVFALNLSPSHFIFGVGQHASLFKQKSFV